MMIDAFITGVCMSSAALLFIVFAQNMLSHTQNTAQLFVWSQIELYMIHSQWPHCLFGVSQPPKPLETEPKTSESEMLKYELADKQLMKCQNEELDL